MMIHDEPGSSLVREIRPDPLQEDTQSEARCRQKLEVYKCPGKPSSETTHCYLVTFQNSKALPYYSHVSLIEVREGTGRRSASHTAVNHLCGMTSLLHRHLRNAGQRFAIFLERCGIADDKNLRMSWNREVTLNAYSTGAICLDVQPFACRRG